MKYNSLFLTYFLKQDIKKRLTRTIVGVAATAIAFLLALWLQPENTNVRLVVLLLGICLSILYLFGGIGTLAAMVGLLVLIVALNTVPSPWNLLFIVLLFAAIPIWRYIKKRRQKRLLLENDRDMTDAQANEIIAKLKIIDQTPYYIHIQREAESIIDAGLLLIETITLPRQKNYLLSLEENDFVLYTFDDMERILSLIDGNKDVESKSNDIKISKVSIDSIKLFATRAFRKDILQISLQTKEANYTYHIPGNISAKKVESLFNEHSDVKINNEVQNEKEPIKSIPDIIEEIKQTDSEELNHIRKIRIMNMFVIALSALCLPLLFFGTLYTPLLVLVPLCCVLTTVFYIQNQQYVMFDGTKQGKSSIFFAYFINPFFTALFAWFIIPEMARLNCLQNHPLTWLTGLLCAAVLLICIFKFLKESRKSIYMKIGMPVIAIVFGLQITAIMLAIIHN